MPNYVPGRDEFMELILYAKSVEYDGHWISHLKPDTNGYTRVKLKGKRYLLHRVVAHVFHSMPLNSDHLVCHILKCKIKACFSPEHLYVGDSSTNTLDTVKLKTHHETRKTHCPKGHQLDGKRGNGKRYCLECNRSRLRKNNA